MSVASESPPSFEPAPRWGREALIGRLVKGRYRVVRLLGSGAMGNVYEVLHERLRSPFALKQLRADLESEPTIVARFRHEAEMMARLGHPNIVRVFDIDADPGFGTWIAMELVHGEDLGALMRRQGALPASAALRIGGQIAAALECAHRAGLVHRDIKPANVLVEAGTGRAVLTDFGIAKSAAASERDAATHSGTFLGTYRYSSPEQIRNQRGVDIDGRADVYSLGVVLYEMVSGKRFLDGLNESEIVSEVGFRADWVPPLRYDEPPPAPLAALIAACLAPRRDDRVASAGEVAARLAACAAPLAGGAPLPPGSVRPSDTPAALVAPRGPGAGDETAATIALRKAAAAATLPHRPVAGGIHSATRAGGPRAVAPARHRHGRRFAVAAAVLLAVAGGATWAFPDRVLPLLGIGTNADWVEIRSVQPADKLVRLTRSDAQWFSVVLEGVDHDKPPRMRWFLNDKTVAENTTTWEYDPTTDLADVTARGEVRFAVGSGRGPHQTHIWKTQTSVKDLSPVLQSASYKPGSTIDAAPGERIEILVDAIDPDGDPLFYTWRVDGQRAGGNEPRLVLDATTSATVTLAVSDGMVSVSSSWKVAVVGAKP